MAEADLSQTTFTSRSASDRDYDISTEDSSEIENENTYTEASSDNSSSDPETKSNAKSEVRKAKADLNWIKFSSRRIDQITEKNLQEMAAWLFSAVFVKAKKQRALNTDWEKNCYCHHESDLKIIHHEKLLRFILSDSHSSTFSDLINQWLLRFKETETDKKNKKAAFTVAEVSAELSSTEDNPRENNCRKVFVISPKYDVLHSWDSPRSYWCHSRKSLWHYSDWS